MEETGKRVPVEVRDWIRKYSAGNITVREHEKLESWIMASDRNMQVFEKLTDPLLQNRTLRITWKRWALAAMVIAVVGLGLVWYIKSLDPIKTKDDYLPPVKYAGTFREGDKPAINLSSIAIGAEHGRLTKKNDSVFIIAASSTERMDLSTNAGSQITVFLPDSSEVIMNAMSDLQVEKDFNSKNRNIHFTGEGCFRVSKKTAIPFMADLGNSRTVEVRGTKFNINNYTNEPAAKISLIEGEVLIKNNGAKETLAPGMQAALIGKSINKPVVVDTNVVLAWSKGYFAFVNEDISSVSRQMERWYGVKAIVEKGDYKGIFIKCVKSPFLTDFINALKTGFVATSVDRNTVTLSGLKK